MRIQLGALLVRLVHEGARRWWIPAKQILQLLLGDELAQIGHEQCGARGRIAVRCGRSGTTRTGGGDQVRGSHLAVHGRRSLIGQSSCVTMAHRMLYG